MSKKCGRHLQPRETGGDEEIWSEKQGVGVNLRVGKEPWREIETYQWCWNAWEDFVHEFKVGDSAWPRGVFL